MFDGGGVPIDHYIIQVGNNTQLETPDPTYSVDVMYNETLTVNISAHNCAGYSDLFTIILSRHEEFVLQNNYTDYTDLMDSNVTVKPESELGSECAHKSKFPKEIPITAAIAIAATSVMLISLLAIHKLAQKFISHRHSRTKECEFFEIIIFSC